MATVSTRKRRRVAGDINIEFADVTTVANGETFTASGRGEILGVSLVKCTTSASVTFTWAAQTITANVSAGAPDIRVAIYMA